MYQIITDGSWDMGPDRAKSLGVEVVPYYISIDGETYQKEIEELNVRDFYTFMINNPSVYPKTSMPTVEDYLKAFNKYACDGIDIICFTLSSKFSGSYNAAVNAGDIIKESYPGLRVTVVDSTLATLMLGLMIRELVSYQRAGAGYDEFLERADEMKSTCRIFFTVENMNYLIHGGRVGKLAGTSANVLNLRPMILMTQGELYPMGLARGRAQSRRKAIEKMLSYIEENGNDPERYCYMTGYGYDEQECLNMREDARVLIRQKWPGFEPDIDIGQIGATIGVYTGPYPIGFGICEKASFKTSKQAS